MKYRLLGWHLQVLVAALMFAKVISKLTESKQNQPAHLLIEKSVWYSMLRRK